MLSWAARGRRAFALVVGLLFGLLFVGLVGWFYTQAARERALRLELLRELDLPPEAFRLESVSGGTVRVAARNVVLLDAAGDTILSAPTARLSFADDVLEGTGPIVLSDVELQNPFLRLVQLPAGDWNIQRAMRVTVDDREITPPDEGRPIVLAGVRITGGRALIATPWAPEAEPAFGVEDLRLATIGGRSYRVRSMQAVDARMPRVRVGGGLPWRIEIADLSARLTDPDLRLAQLRGVLEEVPDGFGFDIQTLRTDRSALAASGRIRTVGDRTLIDLAATADPIDFRDLRWVTAALPAEGTARGAFEVASRPDGRTRVAARNLEVLALDSRVEGRITVLAGGDQPIVFRDTDLLLDPVDLRIAEAFGFGEQVPYVGQVRGRVATLAEVEGFEGPLDIDLIATVRPRDLPGVPVSTLVAQGAIATDTEAGVRLDGLRVGLRPLHLAALRPLLPEQEEWLRGELRGQVLLTGTPQDLRFADGELTYQVGAARESRLAGLTGFLSLEPELSFEITAIAQPLALGTIAEFVPAFPFQRVPLSGPIRIAGTAERVEFTSNLRGDFGGFVAQGDIILGDPLAFRVAGRLDALQPARLVRDDVPFAGPVSGPFVVEGTTRDFRFDVDFVQALGRFALEGRVRLPADIPPIVEAAGRVEEFRIGTLIGRTGLFGAPLTGDIRVSGGGRQAFVFDLDLAGPGAVLAVDGWYQPAAVPVYAAAGRVAGLNLRLVPGLEQLPPTNLVASFSVEGQGTTLGTLAGRFDVDATGTLVGGMPVQAAVARVDVQDGIARFDTLQLALADTRFEATGQWGLTQPAPQPLRFSLVSPNLTALTPVLRAMQMIEPQLTGSLAVSGTVAGTVENPVLDVEGTGRNLRYDGWRAATLAFGIDAALTPAGWSGAANLAARDVTLQGTEQFQSIQIGAAGTPEVVEVTLAARRDRQTDITASGTLELTDGVPLGVALESLELRVGPSEWALQQPTLVRWGEIAGIQVDNLVLQRTGPEEGLIVLDGRMPPTGALDFRVRAENVDVGEFRALLPAMPPVEGVLTLDATLEGPQTAPELSLNARVEGLRYLDAAAQAISIDARYADGAMVADAAVWQDDLQVATARGTIPVQIVFEDLLPRFELLDDQPVTARIVADSLPMALITATIPQVSAGAGVVAAEIEVGGLLGSPQLQGTARVSQGALTVDELNVRIEQIEGSLALQGQSVVIESLTARSLGGAAVSGRIRLDDRTQPLFDLTASFNQFRGMNRADVATVLVTGDIALRGRYPSPTLTGNVELTNGNITLPSLDERAAFEIGALDLVDMIGEPISIEVLEPTFVDQIRIQNLVVVVGEGVWAVSPEMRVNIGGELLVSRFGPDAWQVFGDVQARRGSYTLAIGPLVREFDVVSGRIDFFGTPDLNPALDIVAQHRVRATGPGATGILNILVNVTGTAQFPRVTLTTDTQPPLPESEILSYLIFGRPTFALGEVGGGLAQQLLVQEFAGGLLAAQVEQLIRQAGLPFDYIRVRGRPSPAEFAADPLGTTTLEVGWQVAPDLFWTVEWGVGGLFGGDWGDTWATSLEWQIDPKWSTRVAWEPLRRDRLLQQRLLIGTSELTRQFSLEIRRRWEYGITIDPAPDAVAEAGPGS
jgi:translocation and assembly module TamB